MTTTPPLYSFDASATPDPPPGRPAGSLLIVLLVGALVAVGVLFGPGALQSQLETEEAAASRRRRAEEAVLIEEAIGRAEAVRERNRPRPAQLSWVDWRDAVDARRE